MNKNIETPHLCLLSPHVYRLEENFHYYWRHEGTFNRITVYKGFETDLASVPSMLWSFVNPQELSLSAPLLHDALYSCSGFTYKTNYVDHIRVTNKQLGIQNPVGTRWSRWDADRLFCKVMREENISKWKRRMAFYAVRLFGWYSFLGRRNDKQLV